MTTQKMPPGTGTRPLSIMIGESGADLQEWWQAVRHLDDTLAAEAGRILVYTQEDWDETVRRGEDPYTTYSGTATPWVHFAGARTFRTFAAALVTPLFGADRPLASPLHRLFVKALEEKDLSLLQLVRKVASAAREWTAEDLEDRLDMALEDAYAKTGTHPIWALRYDLDHGYVREPMNDRRSELEPMEFLANCLEGLESGSPDWQDYAYRLFGAAPEAAGA